VVRRRIAFEADPQAFTARWQAQQDALRAQVAQAQRLLPGVALDDAMLELISHLCCEFEVASLRADIVMHKTARAIAALQARARSRRTMCAPPPAGAATPPPPQAFRAGGMDQDKLDDLVDQARQRRAAAAQDAHDAAPDEQEGRIADELSRSSRAEQQNRKARAPADLRRRRRRSGPQDQRGRHAAVCAPASGRRSAVADASRGSAVRAVPDANPDRLAVGATLRSAAVRAPCGRGGGP
jgi:magnesium chelatase subunit D